jgi:hypothetical protein
MHAPLKSFSESKSSLNRKYRRVSEVPPFQLLQIFGAGSGALEAISPCISHLAKAFPARRFYSERSCLKASFEQNPTIKVTLQGGERM